MAKQYENPFMRGKNERIRKMLGILNEEGMIERDVLIGKIAILGVKSTTVESYLNDICNAEYGMVHRGIVYSQKKAREEGIWKPRLIIKGENL